MGIPTVKVGDLDVGRLIATVEKILGTLGEREA